MVVTWVRPVARIADIRLMQLLQERTVVCHGLVLTAQPPAGNTRGVAIIDLPRQWMLSRCTANTERVPS